MSGMARNLADPKVQSRVRRMVRDDRALFFIGSPPCTAFSPLPNLSTEKRDSRVVAEELRAGREHLSFCMELYLIQMAGNRFFIHEHPSDATSWSEARVMEVTMNPQVGSVFVDVYVWDCCKEQGRWRIGR